MEMKPGDNEEARSLLEDDEKGIECRNRSEPQQQRKTLYFFLVLLTNLATSLVAFKTGQLWEGHHQNASTCGSHSPMERPLYAGMDRNSNRAVNFSAFSLMPSPYTATPGPGVDQAWRDLGVEYLTFLVPTSQGSKFGVSDDHVVIPADAPGAHGQSGYAVDMEAMHQLHCLNLIRKGQFFNYDYYSSPDHIKHRPSWAFQDPEHILKGHINHCIDALRERIMCVADDNVLPYYWRDLLGMTISDFAVSRQCKNFEGVRKWAEDHQIDDWGTSYRLTTPEGAYIAADLVADTP